MSKILLFYKANQVWGDNLVAVTSPCCEKLCTSSL